MDYDNTLYLENSIGWIYEPLPYETETQTLKDGSEIHIHYHKVYKDKDAERIPDNPDYKNSKLTVHSVNTLYLKHKVGITDFIVLAVQYRTYFVNGDSKLRCKDYMPFKVPDALYTYNFKKTIEVAMAGYGITLKRCAKLCNTTPAIVRKINKERLEDLAGLMRPTLDDKITDIVIDEFLLSEPMIYCTIVISTTGKLLFLDIGHGKAQLMHFFKWVGKEFVSNLRSIAMDMNCSFSEAVHDIQKDFPNLKIVYDKFHIIQLYNREVITPIRKSQVDILSKEIAEATKNEEWDKVEEFTKARSYIKGQRMLLLANRTTLEAKDKRNKAINELVKQQSIDGGAGNYGVSHRREDFVERYETVLNANELIQNACRLREELQDILSKDDNSCVSNKLDELIEELQQYGDSHFDKFANTLTRRKDGIISIASTKLHSGLVEGVNAYVKALRRMSFGLPDFDYFALLIWEHCEEIHKRSLAKKVTNKPSNSSVNKEPKITKSTTRQWDNKTVFDWIKYPSKDTFELPEKVKTSQTTV